LKISNNNLTQHIASEIQLPQQNTNKAHVSKEVLEQAQKLNNNHKVSVVVDNKIVVLKEESVKSLVEDFKDDISTYNGTIIVKDSAKNYLKKIIDNLSHREHSVLINDTIDTHIVTDSNRDGQISSLEKFARRAYEEKQLSLSDSEKEKIDYKKFFTPFYEELSKLQSHLEGLSKAIPDAPIDKAKILVAEFSALSLQVQSNTAQIIQFLESTEDEDDTKKSDDSKESDDTNTLGGSKQDENVVKAPTVSKSKPTPKVASSTPKPS